MPLTDAACRNATCPPGRKQARYADSGGLYLEVSASGSRRWFWKFRIEGVEKKFALGTYPGLTLAAARKARDAAKSQKASGINPIQARQVVKLKAAVAPATPFARRRLSGTRSTIRAGATTTPSARSAIWKKICFRISPVVVSARSNPSSCWPRCVASRSVEPST